MRSTPAKAGTFRISLTYDAPTGTGKTTVHTDTYHGRFAARGAKIESRVGGLPPGD